MKNYDETTFEKFTHRKKKNKHKPDQDKFQSRELERKRKLSLRDQLVRPSTSEDM